MTPDTSEYQISEHRARRIEHSRQIAVWCVLLMAFLLVGRALWLLL